MKKMKLSLARRLLSALALALGCATLAHADEAQVKRGEYLTRAADCVACHTSDKKQAYGGGVAFATPFGKIYSSNISPDPKAGIGAFTDAEFASAVREGLSRGGKRLYPAMPYATYTQLTDADIGAIRAYLKTVPAVATPTPENTLPFPFNQRWAMVMWNWFNFNSGRFVADPAQSEEWNRGAYLAGPLAHCQECHTPRNFMMGLSGKSFAGATLDGWTAYNITSDKTSGIGGWSQEDIISYLESGAAPGKANAAGPMAEVVENGTRFLSAADLKALAVYVASVRPIDDGQQKPRFAWGAPIANLATVRGQSKTAMGSRPAADGATLYNGNCASCHGWRGDGVGGASTPGAYPSLVHNTVTGASTANNLTKVILHGVQRQTNSTRLVMPQFGQALSDDEVSKLVNFMAQQLGNPAALTTPEQVAKLR